jgi:hypothetical protein
VFYSPALQDFKNIQAPIQRLPVINSLLHPRYWWEEKREKTKIQ